MPHKNYNVKIKVYFFPKRLIQYVNEIYCWNSENSENIIVYSVLLEKTKRLGGSVPGKKLEYKIFFLFFL